MEAPQPLQAAAVVAPAAVSNFEGVSAKRRDGDGAPAVAAGAAVARPSTPDGASASPTRGGAGLSSASAADVRSVSFTVGSVQRSDSAPTPRPAPLVELGLPSDTSLLLSGEDSNTGTDTSTSRPGGDSRGTSTVQPSEADRVLLVPVALPAAPAEAKRSSAMEDDDAPEASSSSSSSVSLVASINHSSSSSGVPQQSVQPLQAMLPNAPASTSVPAAAPATSAPALTPDPVPVASTSQPTSSGYHGSPLSDPQQPAPSSSAGAVLTHAATEDPAQLSPPAAPVAASGAAEASVPAGTPATVAPVTASVPTAAAPPRRLGCRDVSEFEVLEKVGEGTYGVVMRARDPTRPPEDAIVALKKINLEADSKDGLPITAVREIKSLRAVAGHPHIMNLLEVVTAPPSAANKDRGDVFLCFEYADADLSKVLRAQPGHRLPRDYARMYLHQLISGLAHIHGRGWLHRDLKPENLLVTRGNVLKVCDMGLAQVWFDGRRMSPNVVSAMYRAPEIMYGDPFYGPALDMWSVGIIMAQLHAGFAPTAAADSANPHSILEKIYKVCGAPNAVTWPGVDRLPLWFANRPRQQQTCQIKKEYNGLMSPLGIDLLERLLTLCPARRITAAEALEHPYFTAPSPVPLDPAAFPPLAFGKQGEVLQLTKLGGAPAPAAAAAAATPQAGSKRPREEAGAAAAAAVEPDAKRPKPAAPAPAPVPATGPKFAVGQDALRMVLDRVKSGGGGGGLPRPGALGGLGGGGLPRPGTLGAPVGGGLPRPGTTLPGGRALMPLGGGLPRPGTLPAAAAPAAPAAPPAPAPVPSASDPTTNNNV